MHLITLTYRKEQLPVTIEKFLCEPGQILEKNQHILTFSFYKPVRQKLENAFQLGKVLGYRKTFDYLDTDIEGKIEKFIVDIGQEISNINQPLVELSVKCSHQVQMSDLCCDCGEDISGFSEYTKMLFKASIPFSHDNSSLLINKQRAEQRSETLKERLLSSNKLLMVLDLDQTVIQATCNPKISEYMDDENSVNHPAAKDIKKFDLPDRRTYFIKPRPGLIEFLEMAHERYEMHVYTMGTRQYAEEVCKAIDPTQRYFSERIISRDESGSHIKKDLRRLFPVDTSMVVVIDDRFDVWDWSPSLIRIWPFEFFGNGDINGEHLKPQAPLPSNGDPVITVSEPGSEELPVEKQVLIDNDIQLSHVLKVVVELHRRFYGIEDGQEGEKTDLITKRRNFAKDQDVRRILSDIKGDVLKGVNVLFTGIFPLGIPPSSQEPWMWAESFGAQCSDRFNHRVTHVIIGRKDTEKAKMALGRPGVHPVTLAWLYDSINSWTRVDEGPYYIQKPPDNKNLTIQEVMDSACTPTPPQNDMSSLVVLDCDWPKEEEFMTEEQPLDQADDVLTQENTDSPEAFMSEQVALKISVKDEELDSEDEKLLFDLSSDDDTASNEEDMEESENANLAVPFKEKRKQSRSASPSPRLNPKKIFNSGLKRKSLPKDFKDSDNQSIESFNDDSAQNETDDPEESNFNEDSQMESEQEFDDGGDNADLNLPQPSRDKRPRSPNKKDTDHKPKKVANTGNASRHLEMLPQDSDKQSTEFLDQNFQLEGELVDDLDLGSEDELLRLFGMVDEETAEDQPIDFKLDEVKERSTSVPATPSQSRISVTASGEAKGNLESKIPTSIENSSVDANFDFSDKSTISQITRRISNLNTNGKVNGHISNPVSSSSSGSDSGSSSSSGSSSDSGSDSNSKANSQDRGASENGDSDNEI